MKFTIGSDPEYFLQDSGGKLISAIGVVEGSKESPHKVNNGHVHPDNVCIEMNTKPATNKDDFIIVTRNLLEEVRGIALSSGLILSGRSYGEFTDDQLQHPDAAEAGCEPDFNAYTDGKPNTPPNYLTTRARAAGGHIHIGIEGGTPPTALLHRFVKVLDLCIALPMVCRDEPNRRELYGKAGSYRPKPYGLEYRTPSNGWTLASKRVGWVYDQVELAMQIFAQTPLDPEIPDIINNHDTAKAFQVMQKYGLTPMPIM